MHAAALPASSPPPGRRPCARASAPSPQGGWCWQFPDHTPQPWVSPTAPGAQIRRNRRARRNGSMLARCWSRCWCTCCCSLAAGGWARRRAELQPAVAEAPHRRAPLPQPVARGAQGPGCARTVGRVPACRAHGLGLGGDYGRPPPPSSSWRPVTKLPPPGPARPPTPSPSHRQRQLTRPPPHARPRGPRWLGGRSDLGPHAKPGGRPAKPPAPPRPRHRRHRNRPAARRRRRPKARLRLKPSRPNARGRNFSGSNPEARNRWRPQDEQRREEARREQTRQEAQQGVAKAEGDRVEP